MPEDMANAEQEIHAPREEQVAKRWLKMRGVTPPQGTETAEFLDKLKEAVGPKRKAPQAPKQLVAQAYDLFVEKQDLKDDIVAKQREVMEPASSSQALTLEEKRKLIRQGRISALLPPAGKALSYKEVIAKSQARIGEIDNQLEQIFDTPGIYDRFVQDLSHQVRVRRQAREVRSLDRFVENAELVSVRLTREAQVQGRTLTSIEQQVIDENRALAEEAQARKAELLKDPDVFDRVRILELREYRDQLQKDRFAETPSRKRYLEKIERFWAEGKKVLLAGETGTGKTEIIKHASSKLFGVNPEVVTGHQDLSIYELLGKTGFQVQVGDVFRPAPLIRAMTGRSGKGQPFLFDEIDRAPNQSVMGIKTILNARPGEKGVKVQTDTAGSFDVGPDYAVAATANIKSEKYATATELDPAIVRVFDAPIDIDYMPAHEVYDLALATLMDKRGGVPLTENDAKVLLKNLCDAVSWIQNAYQGRKIITDPASGTFLEARGQAATGKPASLKKALLDPGRTLDMLRGWSAAQTRGITFEDYINERILEFINNRAYPEEDRYYLTEIFALKGFLKGRKISELMVSGLDQGTLDRWAESVNRKQAAGSTTPAYLPWNRVARLDPYRRFKWPVSAEVEELLEEEVPEKEAVAEAGGPMIERAKEVLGRDFLGVGAIKKLEQELEKVGVNVEFITRDENGNLPPFPYTEEDLKLAKENGEMLVLRPKAILRGGREVPLTLIEFRELFRKDPLGKMQTVVYSFRADARDWYKGEKFATSTGEIKLGWSLVKKDVLDGSTNTNWNDQEQLLRQYEAGLKRKGAKNTSVKRRTATEAFYDELLYYVNTGERLLPNKCDWTQTRTSAGTLVHVGYFGSYGLHVRSNYTSDYLIYHLGVCPSR